MGNGRETLSWLLSALPEAQPQPPFGPGDHLQTPGKSVSVFREQATRTVRRGKVPSLQIRIQLIKSVLNLLRRKEGGFFSENQKGAREGTRPSYVTGLGLPSPAAPAVLQPGVLLGASQAEAVRDGQTSTSVQPGVPKGK